MQLITDLLIAFTGTNIDNFVFITLMFAASATAAQRRRIVTTQYAGLFILVCISLMGSAALRLIPIAYIRYLGVLPVLIGLRSLYQLRNAADINHASTEDIPGFSTLVLLNLSSGMDNLSVYVPMFGALRSPGSLLALAVIFSLMLLLWCLIAGRIASLSPIRARVQRHSAWLVPAVYVLLGIYILLR